MAPVFSTPVPPPAPYPPRLAEPPLITPRLVKLVIVPALLTPTPPGPAPVNPPPPPLPLIEPRRGVDQRTDCRALIVDEARAACAGKAAEAARSAVNLPRIGQGRDFVGVDHARPATSCRTFVTAPADAASNRAPVGKRSNCSGIRHPRPGRAAALGAVTSAAPANSVPVGQLRRRSGVRQSRSARPPAAKETRASSRAARDRTAVREGCDHAAVRAHLRRPRRR